MMMMMCQMRKSEEPLVVHRFFTWWLIDVCGSWAILLEDHLARITTEPLQRLSDKYCDQQEDLATLGSVQLRPTLAVWTLASRLPGERPLLEMNGDILWTQQRSSGVRSERKKNAHGPNVEVDMRGRTICVDRQNASVCDRRPRRAVCITWWGKVVPGSFCYVWFVSL